MLEGGSSPLSPGSECGPAAAAAEEETKDNEGQVTLKLFSSRTRQSSLQKSVILLHLYYKNIARGTTDPWVETITGGTLWWPNFLLMQVAPPGGQISN